MFPRAILSPFPAASASLRIARLAVLSLVTVSLASATVPALGQSISLAGLRSVDSGVNSSAAVFTAVQMDSAKNLYLLEDESDGVRVLKLNPAGTTVLASVHLGAAGDHGAALALDSSANVYVAGIAASGQLADSGTGSVPFPTAQSSFVAGFTSGLANTFVTSTGGNLASATAIAVASGRVSVAGTISSNTLPVTGNAVVFSLPTGSTTTGFVETFNTSGSGLSFASYLGGPNGNTYPSAIAADSGGNLYVTGSDTATGFPTVNALQPELVGSSDMFLTKLSAASGLEWSTLLGSAGGTVAGTSLALAADGSVYVGVNATTLGLPITNSLVPLPTATGWGLVMNFSGDGSAVNLGTVLGDGDVQALSLTAAGTIAVTGTIHDLAAWPLTTDLQHIGTAFLTILNQSGNLVYSTRLGGIAASDSSTAQTQTVGTGIAVASDGTVALAGYWQALAATSAWLPASLDLPMVNAPNSALPGTLAGTVATAACRQASAACAAAYLAIVSPTQVPEISVAVDTLPNLTVRNLGAAAFTVSAIDAVGFSAATDCIAAGSIPAGGACNVVLTGSGSGSVTVQSSAGSSTFAVNGTAAASAQNALALQPKESLFTGFGGSAGLAQTISVSNLTAEQQILAPSGTAEATFSLQQGSCSVSGGNAAEYIVPANSVCTMAAHFNDTSTTSAQDGPQFGFVTTQISGEPVNAEQFYGYDLDEDHATNAAHDVTASTTSIDFGTNYLGQPEAVRTVILANAGSSAITLPFLSTPAADPDFVVTDNCPVTLPASAQCTVSVSYASEVTSVDSATLTLPNEETLQLAGSTLQQPDAGGLTVNPSIMVAPSTLTFGAVGVGDPSASQTVTVSNSENSAVGITLNVSAGFTQTNTCAGTVPANGNCTVAVIYDPSALGVVHGQLSITPSGSSPVDVALTAGGTNTVNFGAIAVGAPTTQWISLGSFQGTVNASVQGAYQTAVVNGYSYTSPPAIVFAATSSGACTSNCYVGVRTVASAGGTQSGTLTVAEQGESTVTYPLTALANAQTGAELSAYSLSFGSVALGSSSAPQFLTVTNLGNAPLTIASVAASAGFRVANACASTLPGGASCVLEVSFVPAVAGSIAGTVTLVAGGTTLTAQLSGNAASNPAGIAFSPAAVVFLAPSTASTQTVMLSNQGTAVVTITSVSAAASFFSVTGNCGTLQPSGMSASSCTLQLISNGVPAGTNENVTVTVAITAGGASYNYSLPVTAAPTGLGVASASLQAAPATLSFSTAAVGTATSAETLTLTNNGSVNETISVTAPEQFSVDNTQCATLAAGASCTLPVRFLPFSAGSIHGTLEIQSSGATLKVPLNGIGLAATTLAAPAYPPVVQPISLTANPQGNGTTQLLQITNSGSQPLVLSGISATNLIAANNCTAAIAAGASCNVTLQTTYDTQCGSGCTPYSTNVPVTILSNAVSSPDVYDVAQTQSGSDGAATLPGFQLTAGSLTFPQEAIGSSASQSFEVESVNSAALTVAFAATGDFSEKDNCNGSLAGYAVGGNVPFCTVTVTFSPSASGFRIGTLQVNTNAGVQTVSLAGNGPASTGAAATTTTLSASAASVPLGQNVTLTVHVAANSGTGTPTGSVTFYYGSIALTTVTLQAGAALFTIPTAGLPPGAYTLTAKYGGDSGDLASSSSGTTVTITAVLDTTTIVLAVKPATVAAGTAVTLTATVSRTSASGSPAGTVQFYSGSILLGSATLANGVATFALSTTGLPSGTYSLIAKYVGDSTDQPSSSTPVALTVQSANMTTTAFTIAPSTVTAGNSITLKATVSGGGSGGSSPTGTVTFYLGSASLLTAQLSGGSAQSVLATTGVPAGTYVLTAAYSGDASNLGSKSSAASVHVQEATKTTLSATPTSVSPGQTVVLTATVADTTATSTPTGSIAFITNGITLSTGTLSGGVATYSFSTTGVTPGMYSFTANYLGDTNDVASTSTAATVTVQ